MQRVAFFVTDVQFLQWHDMQTTIGKLTTMAPLRFFCSIVNTAGQVKPLVVNNKWQHQQIPTSQAHLMSKNGDGGSWYSGLPSTYFDLNMNRSKLQPLQQLIFIQAMPDQTPTSTYVKWKRFVNQTWTGASKLQPPEHVPASTTNSHSIKQCQIKHQLQLTSNDNVL